MHVAVGHGGQPRITRARAHEETERVAGDSVARAGRPPPGPLALSLPLRAPVRGLPGLLKRQEARMHTDEHLLTMTRVCRCLAVLRVFLNIRLFFLLSEPGNVTTKTLPNIRCICRFSRGLRVAFWTTSVMFLECETVRTGTAPRVCFPPDSGGVANLSTANRL